jgi:hypothetical protein
MLARFALAHPTARESISARSLVVVLQLRIVIFLYSGRATTFDSRLLDALAARREK